MHDIVYMNAEWYVILKSNIPFLFAHLGMFE